MYVAQNLVIVKPCLGERSIGGQEFQKTGNVIRMRPEMIGPAVIFKKFAHVGGRLSACFGNEIHLMGEPPLSSFEDTNLFVGAIFGVIILELIRKRQGEYGSSES